MQSDILLLLRLIFPWLLIILNIFLCAYRSFVYHLWRNICSSPLPIFFFLFKATPVAYEVPRLEVKLELQLLGCTTATAIPDPSCICNLHHSLQQCQILNPLSEARDQIHNLTDTTGFLTCWVMTATPYAAILWLISYTVIADYCKLICPWCRRGNWGSARLSNWQE